jgi:hypothetical protein
MAEEKNYPRWLYHKDFEPIIVRDGAHEKELGEGWKESPAEHGHESSPAESLLPKAKSKVKK